MGIRIDVLPVADEEEATKMMLYHLAMAAAFFEATHDDDGKRAKELIQSFPDNMRDASLDFVDIMCAYYKEINIDDK